MIILNLTQHPATPEQLEAGVVEPTDKASVKALLTFEDLPDQREIRARAADLAAIAYYDGAFDDAAMIGGAPYLMSALEEMLLDSGIQPVYAFSRRESIEATNADGSIQKQNVFRHIGFITVDPNNSDD